MDIKTMQRAADVKLMAAILESKQLHGAKVVTRREMFDLMEPISPREEVGTKKQKMGADFSNMLEEAASKVKGVRFTFDILPSGKRKKVRVEF
jgi:hypothetical protein